MLLYRILKLQMDVISEMHVNGGRTRAIYHSLIHYNTLLAEMHLSCCDILWWRRHAFATVKAMQRRLLGTALLPGSLLSRPAAAARLRWSGLQMTSWGSQTCSCSGCSPASIRTEWCCSTFLCPVSTPVGSVEPHYFAIDVRCVLQAREKSLIISSIM